jgi:tRNA (guanine-N7-)-methyltransferase
MKPKDLKIPFFWNERRPVFGDRVLFVPQHYEAHGDFGWAEWEAPSWFGKPGKVSIEYCSGNGAWIVEKALKHPDHHWIAVEKKFERVRKIWSKIHNLRLPNLVVVGGEALTFSKWYVPPDSVEAVYINFPDPWPKLRHAKHRLIQLPFIAELSRIVKPQGTATLVTDDPDYSAAMIEEMHSHPDWKSSFPAPFYSSDWPDYGSSYFDQLWREKGRTIFYHSFSNHK